MDMMISSSVLVGLVEALKHKAAAVFLRQTGSAAAVHKRLVTQTMGQPQPLLQTPCPSPCPIESRK